MTTTIFAALLLLFAQDAGLMQHSINGYADEHTFASVLKSRGIKITESELIAVLHDPSEEPTNVGMAAYVLASLPKTWRIRMTLNDAFTRALNMKPNMFVTSYDRIYLKNNQRDQYVRLFG